MNVLFTCAGRRGYLLKYFKQELGDNGLILAADMQLTAPALAFADKKIQVPAVYDASYLEVIKDICQKEKIDLLISLNDLELPILSPQFDDFLEIGTKILVSNMYVIDICFDKLKTIEFASKLGIKTPRTFTNLELAIEAIQNGELSLPVVVKPRWGSASIGIEFPQDVEELELAFKLGKKKLKRSILDTISQTDFENSLLIQEMLPGKEFGVDVFNNFNGESIAVYAKEKLAMRAGETDKSALRDCPILEQQAILIGNNLKHIGNIDCDFFVSDNEIYLLEINPRFGGGYPFTHENGGNFVKAIIQLMKDSEVSNLSCFNKMYDIPYAKHDSLIQVGL